MRVYTIVVLRMIDFGSKGDTRANGGICSRKQNFNINFGIFISRAGRTSELDPPFGEVTIIEGILVDVYIYT